MCFGDILLAVSLGSSGTGNTKDLINVARLFTLTPEINSENLELVPN